MKDSWPCGGVEEDCHILKRIREKTITQFVLELQITGYNAESHKGLASMLGCISNGVHFAILVYSDVSATKSAKRTYLRIDPVFTYA